MVRRDVRSPVRVGIIVIKMHFENERASPFVRRGSGRFPMNSLLCVERGARARGCVHRPSCNKRICARECAHVAEQSSADNAISARRTGENRREDRNQYLQRSIFRFDSRASERYSNYIRKVLFSRMHFQGIPRPARGTFVLLADESIASPSSPDAAIYSVVNSR